MRRRSSSRERTQCERVRHPDEFADASWLSKIIYGVIFYQVQANPGPNLRRAIVDSHRTATPSFSTNRSSFRPPPDQVSLTSC